MPAAVLLQQQLSRAGGSSRRQAAEMAELSHFSLLWGRESSLQELMDYEIGSDSRSVLISIRCQRENCPCALSNQEVLMLKAVRGIKLVAGSWNKLRPAPVRPAAAASAGGSVGGVSGVGGGGASPVAGEKTIRVILTDLSTSWFEVLNENGASIPHWGCVRDVARHRPQSIFLRKDQKCLFARSRTGSFDLNADSGGIIKAGTVLSVIDSAKYRVVKHRKVKELPLVKCSDANGHLVFLGLDDKCAVSPVAGTENISGVHTLQSLLAKFQFPLSVRPVFGPPLPWLSFSERYSLRLGACHRGDLLFLASLANPERFFVVTPEMLEHHSFRIGESELQQHVQLLEKHSTRVTQFLQSYHPFEALRYLMKHLDDATNRLAPQERHHGGEQPQRQQPSDVDELLDEVEDIYFYVRTGRMPTHHSRSSCSNDSGLASAPRGRQAEALGIPAAGAFRTSSCENLLERRRPAPPLPPRKHNSPLVRHDPHQRRVAGQSAESLRQSTDSSAGNHSGNPMARSSVHAGAFNSSSRNGHL